MSIDEVRMKIDELKGRLDAPFGSSDKETIEVMYSEVTGRTFTPTSCQQCYHDALIEIYHFLKKYGKMAEKLNYRLKAGAIINSPVFHDGKIFTNDNLTDEIAAEYLKKFPEQADMFQKLPSGGKSGDINDELIKPAASEMPENKGKGKGEKK